MGAAKRKSDEQGILEHSGSAAIESAADLLESIAHAQKLKKRAESAFEDRRRPGDQDGESGDFLGDMIRLNAHYLNELAKLSRRHNVIAHRALENFYSLINPGVKNPSASELEFTREKPTASFAVQNDVNPDVDSVTLEWASIPDSKTRKAGSPIVVEFDGRRRAPEIVPVAPEQEPKPDDCRFRIAVPIQFGVPKVVKLKVNFDELLERRYKLELLVRLPLRDEGREQLRRIPLTIDAREKGEEGQ